MGTNIKLHVQSTFHHRGRKSWGFDWCSKIYWKGMGKREIKAKAREKRGSSIQEAIALDKGQRLYIYISIWWKVCMYLCYSSVIIIHSIWCYQKEYEGLYDEMMVRIRGTQILLLLNHILHCPCHLYCKVPKQKSLKTNLFSLYREEEGPPHSLLFTPFWNHLP